MHTKGIMIFPQSQCLHGSDNEANQSVIAYADVCCSDNWTRSTEKYCIFAMHVRCFLKGPGTELTETYL